ncbi:MAG: hypothetical protein V4496_03135 [Pseudomonadota bacterium]
MFSTRFKKEIKDNIAKLTSRDLEEKKLALDVIKWSVISDDENCIAVRELGGIAHLVTLLRDRDAEVRESAAEALTNLTSENVTNKAFVAHAGAIEPLAALLLDNDNSIKENAAEALSNLIVDNRNIAPVVSLLKNPNSIVRQFAALILGNLAADNSENREAIAKASAIPKLITLLNDSESDIKKAAIIALFNLMLDNLDNQKLALQASVIKPLATIFCDRDVDADENIASLLMIFMNNNIQCQQDFIQRVGGFARLKDFLKEIDDSRNEVIEYLLLCRKFEKSIKGLSSNNLRTKQDSIEIIKNLLEDCDQRTTFRQLSGIESLVPLLNNPDRDIVENTIEAFSYLCYEIDESGPAIIRASAIPLLLRLLPERDPNTGIGIRENVADLLNQLLMYAKSNSINEQNDLIAFVSLLRHTNINVRFVGCLMLLSVLGADNSSRTFIMQAITIELLLSFLHCDEPVFVGAAFNTYVPALLGALIENHLQNQNELIKCMSAADMNILEEIVKKNRNTQQMSSEHQQFAEKTLSICRPAYEKLQQDAAKGLEPIIEPVTNGDLKKLKAAVSKLALSQAGVINLNCIVTSQPNQETLLHIAIRQNYVAIMQYLLEQGASKTIINGQRQTPAALARALDLPLMLFLLSEKTDLNRAFQAITQNIEAEPTVISLYLIRARLIEKLVEQSTSLIQEEGYFNTAIKDLERVIRAEPANTQATELHQMFSAQLQEISAKKLHEKQQQEAQKANAAQQQKVQQKVSLQSQLLDLQSGWESNNPKNTLEQYAELMKQFPKEGEIYRERGNFYACRAELSSTTTQKTKLLESAKKDFEKALDIDSFDDEAAEACEKIMQALQHLNVSSSSSAPKEKTAEEEKQERIAKRVAEIKAQKAAAGTASNAGMFSDSKASGAEGEHAKTLRPIEK